MVSIVVEDNYELKSTFELNDRNFQQAKECLVSYLSVQSDNWSLLRISFRDIRTVTLWSP